MSLDAPSDPRPEPPDGLITDWVDGFWELDPDEQGILCRPVRDRLGWSDDVGLSAWRSQVHPDDEAGITRAVADLRDGRGERIALECRLRRADGGWHPVLAVGRRRGDRLHGILVDLPAVPVERVRFRQTMEMLDDVVSLHVDDLRPIFVTQAITRLTGRTPDAVVREANLEWIHPEDRRNVLEAMARARRAGEATVRWRIRCADGIWRWMETRGRLLDDPTWYPARMLCASRDIHDEVEATTRARWQAAHDPLTNLPNRTYFLERVGHAIDRLRPGRLLGVLFLDLDGFKHINDTLGHAVGDTLLQAVADRLQENVRSGDVVARMGGDEFTVLLSRLSSVEEGVTIARRVRAAIARPVSCGERELFVTSSIGASFYPGDGTTAEILLRHADLAMYQAKKRGNNLCLFEPAIDAAARDRLRLEHLVRRGLERDEFELHYQPLVNLRTGTLRSIEALLRWRNRPGEAPVSPDRLVAQAERTGLMEALGDWILDSACRQGAAWCAMLPDDARLSVNISAIQLLADGFVPHLLDTLYRTGLPPERLELEVTETIALTRERHAPESLRALRERGIRITLDDFGQGFSSLSLLRDLPLDAVKVDATFLDGLSASEQAQALLRSVIGLAHALRLGVVAEGVEHEAQREALAALGCDAIQGYLISPPVSGDAIPAMLGGIQPAQRFAA